MAFYSASIDEDGHETKRTLTSRTYSARASKTYSARASPAVVMCESLSSARQSEPGAKPFYKTVRYVNPAAFIGEASESDPVDTSKSNSSNSMNNVEPGNDLVPNLELSSNESFPSSSDDMCYSYGKACEVSKIITKPDAFAAWLSAKKKTKSYELLKKKAEEEEKERQREEKKRQAEQQFQVWLARKSETKLKVEKKKSVEKGPTVNIQCENRPLSKQDFDRNFQAWLKKKIEKNQEMKCKLNKNVEMQRRIEDERRAAASELYEEWLKQAANKPKPVPLNRGLLTLKGTISDIYINPDPWRTEPNVESFREY